MQQSSTFLMRGGLNLVTPPVASQPGTVTASVNYEPDVDGASRIVGYERFDGQASPSSSTDADTIASLRSAITTVPGTGRVRGVLIYDGAVYAFRDTEGGAGGMYKSTTSGWVQQTFGDVVNFTAGTTEFAEGETVTGGTSGATGSIKRVVVRSGTWAGNDAAGYLVISSKSGTFQPAETITSSSGSATCSGEESVGLESGGAYVGIVHNFYGATESPRLYFTNGVNSAMEWDGETLVPIRSGTDAGPIDLAAFALNETGGNILMPDDGRVLLVPDFDIPDHCAVFSNHLFLGFENGGVVHSGVGEPVDFRAAAGAGTFSVSSQITQMLGGALTALIIFCRGRIEYLSGSDSSDFVLATLSDTSGALSGTAQMISQPYYFDDGGMRTLSAASSFGDWVIGAVTEAIQPLIRTIQDAGTLPAASVQIKRKGQYRLFYDDGTGLAIYLGRNNAELMPLKFPFTATCATADQISSTDTKERIFVGATDGYVYEMEKGTSFDGSSIPAYLRTVWNHVGAPGQNKRYHSVTFGVDSAENITLAVTHHVDYGRAQEGSGDVTEMAVAAGSMTDWAIADYDSVDWTVSDQGELKTYLDGFGRNIAITVISNSATEPAHTLLWQRINFTPRGIVR